MSRSGAVGREFFYKKKGEDSIEFRIVDEVSWCTYLPTKGSLVRYCIKGGGGEALVEHATAISGTWSHRLEGKGGKTEA